MKKRRIRIHKQTLRNMNNPEYVYIWINPKENTIAICACDKENRDAVRVKTSKDCEIYSAALFYELGRLNRDLDDDCTYRINGKLKRGDRISEFSMGDAFNVNTMMFRGKNEDEKR